MTFKVPEVFRVRGGSLKTSSKHGNNGYFLIKKGLEETVIVVIASDGMGWEHVSVTIGSELRKRCPTWEEMCFIKDLFWDEEDTVMQLHPPKSQQVNYHNYCLHLWLPIGQAIPAPPSEMVGPTAKELANG